ncbi:hypothetical protein SEA_WATERT_100 [Microbacterium phage WaterT]|nr:hypothetical protein SEA_WATERT_100 [Microbacterium phage WaterT]
MIYLDFGLSYPEEDDCYACCFGKAHESDCIGVNVRGEKVYNSPGMDSIRSNLDIIQSRVWIKT